MREKLQLLKSKIDQADYKKELNRVESFSGAGLIITHKGDKRTAEVVVFTKYEKELSWLVYKLKNIYANEIDYLNKYNFYPKIGKLANEFIALNGDNDISSMMKYILDFIWED